MPFFFPSLLSCLKYLFFLFYYSTLRLFLYISSTACLSSPLSIILPSPFFLLTFLSSTPYSRLPSFTFCISLFLPVHLILGKPQSRMLLSLSPFSALLPAIGNTSLWAEAVEDNESCWLNWNWGNIPEHLQVELPNCTCCFHIFSYFVASLPRSPLTHSLGTPPRLSCLFIYACAGVCLLCEYVMRPRVMEGKGNLRWHSRVRRGGGGGGIHLLMPAKCF